MTNKRTEALNALADIRDWARLFKGQVAFTPLIIDRFNVVAQALGADKDWCQLIVPHFSDGSPVPSDDELPDVDRRQANGQRYFGSSC